MFSWKAEKNDLKAKLITGSCHRAFSKKKPLKKELFDSCTPIDSDGTLQIVPNQNFTTVTWTKSGFLPFSKLLGIEIVRASCWDQ